jgi:hypothetical protein
MPIDPEIAKVFQALIDAMRPLYAHPCPMLDAAQAALDAGTQQPPAQDFSQGDQGGAV